MLARLTVAAVALLSTQELTAQSLRVTAANSSAPDAVYDVLFTPAGTTLLNSDGNALKSLRSLVFAPGAAGGVDLIVADTAGGAIVRYVAPTGTPTIPSVPSGAPPPTSRARSSLTACRSMPLATCTPSRIAPLPRCGYCVRRLPQPVDLRRRFCSTLTSWGARSTRWSTH